MSKYTTEQMKEFPILVPRFEVMFNTPFSPFVKGEIIELKWCMIAGAFRHLRDSVMLGMVSLPALSLPCSFFTQFPETFRLLPWYEGRKPEDFPKYLRLTNLRNAPDKIVKVEGNDWAYFIQGMLAETITPATEQEYRDYMAGK